MDVSLNVGLSHQMAMRRNMDVIANNMANMNTVGFKKEAMMFEEYLDRMQGSSLPKARDVSYVIDRAIVRDFTEGKQRITQNPLDLALNGQNFFTVQMPDGTTSYTRNGQLTLSADGTLMTSTGHPILDRGGAPIQFMPEDTDVAIAKDGTISTTRGEIGQIAVVQFTDLTQLEKAGDGLFLSNIAPIPSEDYVIASGMLEDSNVEPIIEMTRMMDVSRRYQSVARALEDQQELYTKSINRLAKVG